MGRRIRRCLMGKSPRHNPLSVTRHDNAANGLCANNIVADWQNCSERPTRDCQAEQYGLVSLSIVVACIPCSCTVLTFAKHTLQRHQLQWPVRVLLGHESDLDSLWARLRTSVWLSLEGGRHPRRCLPRNDPVWFRNVLFG